MDAWLEITLNPILDEDTYEEERIAFQVLYVKVLSVVQSEVAITFNLAECPIQNDSRFDLPSESNVEVTKDRTSLYCKYNDGTKNAPNYVDVEIPVRAKVVKDLPSTLSELLSGLKTESETKSEILSAE